MEQQIDDNLRRVYADTANEPLPERFTQLLDRLRDQEQDKSDKSSEDDA
ncbi:NepR family anti-sigma factor [Roseovarius sp. MMSF_3281]|nr:NepR family anti-sigma factor [Roseovarius sp. MMSF_3281]